MNISAIGFQALCRRSFGSVEQASRAQYIKETLIPIHYYDEAVYNTCKEILEKLPLNIYQKYQALTQDRQSEIILGLAETYFGILKSPNKQLLLTTYLTDQIQI